MAVQKSKKSRSKRDKRRNANTVFKIPTVSKDKETGEMHLRHFITETGFYKGKKIINIIKKKKKNKKKK